MKIYQKKPLKLKYKGKNGWKKKRTSKNCGAISKGVAHVTGIVEEERENWADNIFEEIVAKNFPKLLIDTKLWGFPGGSEVKAHLWVLNFCHVWTRLMAFC